ncbi:MAG: hypothetical protein JJE52_13565 [Acidimicrobiia bacterium]|nr:hypothetical protein [Acidimicrobiia bacterium]
MSGFKFEFDERAIRKLAQKAVDEAGREFQQEMDRLHRSYGGQPVAVVKPAVRAALRRIDVTASDEEITDYAEVIARGDRIVVDVERL